MTTATAGRPETAEGTEQAIEGVNADIAALESRREKLRSERRDTADELRAARAGYETGSVGVGEVARLEGVEASYGRMFADLDRQLALERKALAELEARLASHEARERLFEIAQESEKTVDRLDQARTAIAGALREYVMARRRMGELVVEAAGVDASPPKPAELAARGIDPTRTAFSCDPQGNPFPGAAAIRLATRDYRNLVYKDLGEVGRFVDSIVRDVESKPPLMAQLTSRGGTR